MNTWQTLRSWKFFLEFLAGLSLLLTAAFFITAMNKNQTTMDKLRQADAAVHHVEQAEAQLSMLAEPSTQIASTWYAENLGETYLGPLASMREGFTKNQTRINSLIESSQAIQTEKIALLSGITEMEAAILNFKQNSEIAISRSEVSYLAAATAWLTHLKTAIYIGNLDAASIERLNILTQDMQGENLKSAAFSQSMGLELATFMGSTQMFLDNRSNYQVQYDKSISSILGLKVAALQATSQWAADAKNNLMTLWIACFLGIGLSALLFWKLFNTKHFSVMLAGSPQEARLIENSEFVHQVEELLGVVDQNWANSKKESSVLNSTAIVNEDVKRNIHQLNLDIRTRNAHEEDQFSSIMNKITQLKSLTTSGKLTIENMQELEQSLLTMHQHLMMDNKSVSDDFTSVENSMFSLDSDMSKLQVMMNRVVQDSRKLLKLRTKIEETEQISDSI